MSYLTYSSDFQQEVIKCKESGMKVKDIINKFSISTYTLYKILHMNGKMPTPSQASEGKGSEEGVEHRQVSPNDNLVHERSTSTWKYGSDRHLKKQFKCKRCGRIFYVRDRGRRVKFCSVKCKCRYRTEANSVDLVCDNCCSVFSVKKSASKHYIHCADCRGLNLGRQSSKQARILGDILKKHFIIESEKTFDWFYDKNKPNGRFRLDYFLLELNVGIEYDGEQHFKPSFTSRWESVSVIQKRDKMKTELCNKHGIKIIRFRYDKVLSGHYVLMKIYAELQGNELVEVEDKKLLR